ncbi:MAG: hypothetical protein AAFO91_04060, partial [Bacteroidota bacterium]
DYLSCCSIAHYILWGVCPVEAKKEIVLRMPIYQSAADFPGEIAQALQVLGQQEPGIYGNAHQLASRSSK